MEQERSILIVDDQPAIRTLLAEVLSKSYNCVSVESASEALRLMEAQRYHLALVDLGLSGMSGLSLCRLLTNRYPRTPVIVVSGQSDSQSQSEAFKAGASEFLQKPFNVGEAVAAVNRVLTKYSPGAVA